MHKELEANTTLSHYRIVSKIGAGGMGEVYLVQDTKLDRKVAIRLVHEEFSRDLDKLAVFIQEAKGRYSFCPPSRSHSLAAARRSPEQRPDYSGLNES